MRRTIFWWLADADPRIYRDGIRQAANHQARRFALGLGALLTLLPTSPVHAQTRSPAYDPTQFDKRLDSKQPERTLPGRSRLPMPKLAQPAVPPADPTPLFLLRRVSIVGATAISPDRLTTAYQPYIGKKVSQADLVAIAGNISAIYRTAGFHLSRAIVPPQDINEGSIRVQVIEGSITEIGLKGEDAEQFGVRGMLGPVLAEQPARLTTLERQLLLINSRPGVRIEDTMLDEIDHVSGRFRLTVLVRTWHIYTAFGLDNLSSSAVGPWQSFATAAFNSYLAQGDTLAVNLSSTPADPRQLAYGRLSYDVPIGTDGLKIGASGVYSDVWPGDYRHAYSDNTATESFELRASISPLQSQRSTWALTAAIDITNAAEGDVSGQIYKDRVRAVNLMSDYRLEDNFGGTNYLTVTLRQGLDILGASHSNDDFLSRDGASSNFSALNAWFTRYQTLTDTVSLKIVGTGQLASGPLFLSQQFYLGGAAFGRGYGAAEISGDNGMAGSIELRFDRRLNSKYLTGYQLYSFVDSGVAWNDGFRYTDGISLISVGGGVRFFLANNTQADFAVAVPLSYRAPDNPARELRVLFSLTTALELCPVRASTRGL